MKAIDNLRKRNYRVFVTHRRFYEDVPGTTDLIEEIQHFHNTTQNFEIIDGFVKTKCQAAEEKIDPATMLSAGGKTTVTIYDKDDNAYEGSVYCSVNENYQRIVGRGQAFSKAWQKLKPHVDFDVS